MVFMEHLRHKPDAVWKLDDTTPFQDYSGYGRSGVVSGTETHAISLSSDTVFSQVFDNTKQATFASPAYVAGRESEPFTLCASVYITPSTSDIQILSNLNQYDGLSVNGTVISFSTSYVGQGEAKVSYDLVYTQRVDVVGVHTKTKNSLYVNGELVGEIDITAAQQLAVYSASNTNLYSGKTAGTGLIAVNNVAVYSKDLGGFAIKAIYEYNNRSVEGDPVKMYGGNSIYFSSQARPSFLTRAWTSADDWERGVRDSVSIDNDQLNPDLYNGVTINGTWTTSVNIALGEVLQSIQAINMDWDGENVSITRWCHMVGRR
jgi:hypothetical protein